MSDRGPEGAPPEPDARPSAAAVVWITVGVGLAVALLLAAFELLRG